MNANDILKTLSKTNDVYSWVLFQVAFPLIPISLLVFYLHVVEGIKDGFVHILGAGVILLFSTLLLLSVIMTIKRVRSFARKLNRDIGLDRLENMIILLSFSFLLIYGINVATVYYCKLVQNIPLVNLTSRMKIWAFIGLIGGLVSIVFSLGVMFRMIRALKVSRDVS